MAIQMDTEDRFERGLSCLEGLTDMVSNCTSDIITKPGNLAALLDLIHSELRETFPTALARRMGSNDHD